MANRFTYLISKNKKAYIEIAKAENVSPVRVYLLAHGRKAKSDKDFRIIASLVERGIVSGWRIGSSPV